MDNKQSYDELTNQLQTYLPLLGKTIRHIKTGNIYKISFFAFQESNMEIQFLYCPANQPHIHFSRPITEWTKERFEIV